MAKIRTSLNWITIPLFLILIVGCDNNATVEETTPLTEEETASPLSIDEDIIEVTLTEYEIQMPNVVEAGETVFQVTNTGEIPHNFEIEGMGIEKEFEENLEPGEIETMIVDLEPGEYRIYCPVGNHAEQGMELTLSVVPQETPQVESN
jgi:plastocyanin